MTEMMEKRRDKSRVQEDMIILRKIQSVPSVSKLMERIARGVE